MSTAEQIAQFIRWRDWGPGKITVLISLSLYIAVAYEIPFVDFLPAFVVFLFYAAMQSALGYVLNDWGDRELDRKQFKHNTFNGMSRMENILALTLIVVIAIISGLPLIARPGFVLLWLAWIVAATTYSLKPLRLKTRNLAGLVVSFVAQWFLPVLITFAAFQVAGRLDMWLFAIALTISGATLELGHQRWDRERDKQTRAETFAVGISSEHVDRLYAFMLVLDKVAIGLVVATVVSMLSNMETQWAFGLAVVLVGAYVVLMLATLRITLEPFSGGTIDDPYFSTRMGTPSLSRLLHETLLNFVVPVTLGIAATIVAPFYAIILALFLVWRVVMGGADMFGPLREIKLRPSKPD